MQTSKHSPGGGEDRPKLARTINLRSSTPQLLGVKFHLTTTLAPTSHQRDEQKRIRIEPNFYIFHNTTQSFKRINQGSLDCCSGIRNKKEICLQIFNETQIQRKRIFFSIEESHYHDTIVVLAESSADYWPLSPIPRATMP